eukprot:2316604-Rhodomonas_salina.1
MRGRKGSMVPIRELKYVVWVPNGGMRGPTKVVGVPNKGKRGYLTGAWWNQGQEKTASKYGGTGLGLWVVRSAILLRRCYAMSGTDIVYGGPRVWCHALCGTARGMALPVVEQVLSLCSTELGCAATCITELGYGDMQCAVSSKYGEKDSGTTFDVELPVTQVRQTPNPRP